MGFGKRRTRKKDRPAKQSAAGRRDKPGSRAFLSVQGMIGFESVAASGLCWLGGDRYSVCLRLSDINYCLAPPRQDPWPVCWRYRARARVWPGFSQNCGGKTEGKEWFYKVKQVF